MSFTVTLDHAVQGGFTVNYATANGTATSGSDYVGTAGSLTFAGTASETQTIDVTINGDNVVEADETFTVSLSNPSVSAIDVTDTATGTIHNDDTAGITVNPTSGLVTTEAGGTDSFTVVLDIQPTADVTVNLSSSNSAEGTIDKSSLTFTAATGIIPQTVTLTVADNSVADGTRTATITHTASSSDSNYDGITVGDFTLTIADDDSPGLTLDPTSGSVTEGGSTTYTVALNTQPANDVTVTLSADRGEITVNPPTLTFTSGDWDTPRTVTLPVADNAAFDGNRTGIVTHTTSSVDTNYDALTADFTLAIADDDTPGSTTTQPTAAPSSATPTEILRLLGLPESGAAALLFPGSTTVWTFTIQNISTMDAHNVTALVTYPDDDMVGVSATSDRGSQGTFRHGSLLTSYNLGTLHPGEIVTLTITTQLPDRGGTFVGTLTATADGIAQSSTATLTRVAVGGLPSTGETPWWRDLAPVAAGVILLAGASLFSLQFWRRKRQLH